MEELELLAGCLRGEHQSRMQFLEKYSRLIYTYIKAVVIKKGPSCYQHIDDIFQEIYCVLFADNARKLRSYKGLNGCTLASWLRQVTINFTIDYLDALPDGELSLDRHEGDQGSLESIVRDPASSAVEQLLEKEQLQKLKECIEALDTQARYFLELHLHQRVSLKVMREHLKTSRAAVDMYKSRLLARLRECFKSKGFIDG